MRQNFVIKVSNDSSPEVWTEDTVATTGGKKNK